MQTRVGRKGTGAEPFEFTIRPAGVEMRIRHWPILAFVEGDLMMMYKLMLTLPHSAKEACPRCAIQGKSIRNAMRCDDLDRL